MTTPGKLEVAIKINQLPTEVTTTKAGWKEFKNRLRRTHRDRRPATAHVEQA